LSSSLKITIFAESELYNDVDTKTINMNLNIKYELQLKPVGSISNIENRYVPITGPIIIIVFSIKLCKPLYFSSVSGVLISENNTLEAISKNFEIILIINEIKNKKVKELKFLKYKNRIKYNIEVRKSHIKIIFFLLNFSIIVPIKIEIIVIGKLTAAKKIPVVFRLLVMFNIYNGKTIKYIVLPNKDTALPNNNNFMLLSLLCTLTLHIYFYIIL